MLLDTMTWMAFIKHYENSGKSTMKKMFHLHQLGVQA